MLIEAVPVRLVTTPDAGVPNAGVTNVGLVAKTMLPVPVTELLSVTPPYVSAPVVESVVNAPVEAVEAPMVAPLMVPAVTAVPVLRVLFVRVWVAVVPTISPAGCVPIITVPVASGRLSVRFVFEFGAATVKIPVPLALP
jgi:hypothetical protein